jgi:hypothetical protein
MEEIRKQARRCIVVIDGWIAAGDESFVIPDAPKARSGIRKQKDICWIPGPQLRCVPE